MQVIDNIAHDKFELTAIPCWFSNFSNHQLGSKWGQTRNQQKNFQLFCIEKPPISVEIGGFLVAERQDSNLRPPGYEGIFEVLKVWNY